MTTHPCPDCGQAAYGDRCRKCRDRTVRPATQPCVVCGVPFSRKRKGRDVRLCCSRTCGFEYLRQEAAKKRQPARERQTPTSQSCPSCGKDAGLGYGPRYCSVECRASAQNTKAKAYYRCHADEIKARQRVKYHTDALYREQQNSYSRQRSRQLTLTRALHAHNCENCQKPFQWRGKAKRRFCSERCSRRWANHQNLRRYLPNRDYSPDEIFERDVWCCGLCHRRVNKRLRWPHARSATLDHIIPLSRGGSDGRENVQLAHADCNWNKRELACGSQLLLVG